MTKSDMEPKIFDAKLSDLKPTAKNPRQLSEKGYKQLKKKMDKYPKFITAREVVIDEDFNILGGHQRVKVAEKRGDKTIRVKQVFGWTQEEKDNFIISDNVAEGDWDRDILANEWDENDLSEWMGDEFLPHRDIVEDEPAPVDEENTYSVVGGIYQLGEHRVFCGSFEDDEKVRELFGNKKATCTFTDPPYNVAVKNRSTGKTIQNDNMGHEDFQDFLNRAFECVAAHMKPRGGGGSLVG